MKGLPVPYAIGADAYRSLQDGRRRLAILLSASEPVRDPELEGERRIRRQRHLATARPFHVRDAVTYVCRFAFQRDYDVVMAAEPAMVALVLDEARRFIRPPAEPRVLAFQIAGQHDRAALALANWTWGALVEIPPGPASRDRMRREMRAVPRVAGALFVGGSDDVLDDYATWRADGLPSYPIGSTGSAAQELLKSGQLPGRQMDPRLLDQRSMPLVISAIFADIA